MLSLSFQPGLIIKLEEKQVEGPQCDGEIFLFSSATACWSPCWGLPPPAISPSNLPFISSSFLSCHLSLISCFLYFASFILPTSFLTSSSSPSHINSLFGSDSPSFLHFFLFFYPQIMIDKPNHYTMKKYKHQTQKISTTKTQCRPSLSPQVDPP